MAKFTAGIGFGQASGSVAGTTYSRNRFGPYMRNRAVPVNPNTPAQGLARTRLAQISGMWRTLTAPQRQAWNAAAAAIPLVDKLGQTYYRTGFGYFQHLNQGRFLVGANMLPTPPPNLPPTAQELLGGSWDLSTGIFEINLTGNVIESLLIWATGRRSPGVTFAGPKEYRLLTVAPDATATPINITANWTAVFGSAPTIAGERISVRVQNIDQFGQRSTLTEAWCPIVP